MGHCYASSYCRQTLRWRLVNAKRLIRMLQGCLIQELTLHIVGPDMREGQSPQVILPV